MSSKGFTEFIKDLGSVINNYESESKDFMKKVELEVVANTQLNSPVLTGNLKKSWTFDEPIKIGNTVIGVVGAEAIAPYAEAVENGHTTNGGGYVAGQFMLKKATEKIQFQNKVEKFYADITKKAGL